MIKVLMNIVLGLLPEVLYFTMFLIYAKKIEKKKILLFLFISVAYFVCLQIKNYVIIHYVIFVALVYLILKILYKSKTQIIDIFVFSISTIYLALLSCIMWPFVNNWRNYTLYYLLYVLNRILMFIPFIFRNKFNKVYRRYCLLWNRNDQIKRPIKSITLRNISLIIINVSIFLGNILLLSIIK